MVFGRLSQNVHFIPFSIRAHFGVETRLVEIDRSSSIDFPYTAMPDTFQPF